MASANTTSTDGDISSDKVFFNPSFAQPIEDHDVEEWLRREQTKSPSSESENSFDLMSNIGEDEEQKEDEEQPQMDEREEEEKAVANDADGCELEDEAADNEQQNDDDITTPKKCIAIVQVRSFGTTTTNNNNNNNASSKHYSDLKFEFTSATDAVVTEEDEQQQPHNPTIGQMIGALLPDHFGIPVAQLTAQFDLLVQMREQSIESMVAPAKALFVDIAQRKWSTERVQHHGFYRALLGAKLDAKQQRDTNNNNMHEATKNTTKSASPTPSVQQQPKKSPSDAEAPKSTKRGGQIVFRMPNAKAFLMGCGAAVELSEPAKMINGMPWRIRVKYGEEHIRVDVYCAADQNDMAWSVSAAFTVGVVSRENADQWVRKKSNLDDFRLFDAITPYWGSEKFARTEKLLDPKNCVYDEQSDVVTFKAQICAERPKGMRAVLVEDTLMVNDRQLHVNKHGMAMHSKYFQELFFGVNAQQEPKIFLDGGENAVANFKRLIASTTSLQSLQLDDKCVGGVLQLAHRFQFEHQKNRCVAFLMTNSKMRAIPKFLLAHQCSIAGMKKKVLKEMTMEDFAVTGDQFVENLLAYKQLDEQATKELLERHKELFEPAP